MWGSQVEDEVGERVRLNRARWVKWVYRRLQSTFGDTEFIYGIRTGIKEYAGRLWIGATGS